MNSIEEIKNEISLYGNTNFITDSGLKTGQQIFAIGDSHCIFFYNSMKIKEHWFYGQSGLPLTIYKLLLYELNIYTIGNCLDNGHDKYNIKENDFVVFFFGFNDIQRNIKLHYNNNWKEGIRFLISNYIEKIIKYRKMYKIIPIISCIYPNPRENAKGQNPLGTLGERQQYTLYANLLLKQLCDKENLLFLDIYDIITDKYGFIKKEVTADFIHLDYNNILLKMFVETEIINLCKSFNK